MEPGKPPVESKGTCDAKWVMDGRFVSHETSGQLMGMPYIVNAEHAAYDSTRFSTPPLMWSDVISAGLRFAIPAGDDTHVDTLISLYLSTGGTLTDASGAPHLDTGPLADMLRLLSDARRANIIVNAMQMKSADDAWAAYRAGTPLAIVSAERYLADRNNIGAVAAMPLPGLSGPAPALGSAWVWVLVTRDPVRGPLAEQLLNHLTTPQNLGGWSRAASHVPARREALAVWEALSEQADPYVAVLLDVLGNAIARPSAEVYAAIAPALRQAAVDVLSGRATPETAAAAAVKNVGK
jgi:ABC-type glycerol-3-phosphate transport system substrate-binding protein